jgi:hypothetical protein
VFTFTFTDPAGFSDLTVLDVLINYYLDGQTACYFALASVSASTGYLYLVDDTGDGGYVTRIPMLLPLERQFGTHPVNTTVGSF